MGEPGFCARKYTKDLTVPRIIDGQRVVFQSDSSFGSGPGHTDVAVMDDFIYGEPQAAD
ncbi:MAG: hypothetical protein M3R23_04470 [Actinomycetota bacterium]|nr:hypothetical protein [Actinomycetota bacterium]